MKVALVHDWLVTSRGGEKVLEAICELFPDAEVFTLLHEPGSAPPGVERMRIHTSFVDRIPLARRRHRHLLPLYPFAIESLPLEGFDAVISSSHCVAKGVRAPPGVPHLCYLHAPMRYMWDRFDDYFGRGRAPLPLRFAARVLRPWLQGWDQRSARGVDRFVANSHHIARKVAELYGRQAAVVHPPVDLDRFLGAPAAGSGGGGYFLWFGALAPYKRADLALEAFAELGLPLWLAGSGQDEGRLRRSLPPNVRMLGPIADAELPELYRGARALVFTGEEDFGITPVEAQACGRPVIAFGRGGALETVTPRTGVFFYEQTPESLADAVRGFEAFEAEFDPAAARANAMRFSKELFQARFLDQLAELLPLAAKSSWRGDAVASPA